MSTNKEYFQGADGGLWTKDGPLETKTSFFNGDCIQFTGEPPIKLHGGTYFKYIYIEGHKSGQECVIPESKHINS